MAGTELLNKCTGPIWCEGMEAYADCAVCYRKKCPRRSVRASHETLNRGGSLEMECLTRGRMKGSRAHSS